MIDRFIANHPEATRRINSTGSWTLAGLGIGLAVLLVGGAMCNTRVNSTESSRPGNLHDFGYDIDSSNIGPNIVRITARRTVLPPRYAETSYNNALSRAARDCGGFTPAENALERASVAGKVDLSTVIITYGSVPNRACLGE